jgi:predicted AAA+ superfamily ATPase
MWINRELNKEIAAASKSFAVVVLTGPRQVGKTSLLERLFPAYSYVSLDSGSLAEMAETRPDDFLAGYPPPVIIDEVQYAPAIFRTIKNYTDQHRSQKGLFILSGSQNFMLMKNVSESLAGRAAVLPFLGLSAAEWAAAYNPARPSDWLEFLWRGSYPELWADSERPMPRDRWYQGYLATYLERDLRNLLKVGSLRDFERFLRVCASRCGQTLNMSEMGREIGISTPTVKEWLSVLQASNMIYLLEPYYRSLGKRLAKSPKLYFTDTGLAAFLMGLQSADLLLNSNYAGHLWENHVVSQWLRWRDWHHPAAALWFWRDQSGNEVDLIIETNRKLFPIECKFKEKPDRHDLKGINQLIRFYGSDEISAAYIACRTSHPFNINREVAAVPGWTCDNFPRLTC